MIFVNDNDTCVVAAIGADPQQALLSGTFAPGNVNDSTGKGNTCDVANDAVGCAISQKLIVDVSRSPTNQ